MATTGCFKIEPFEISDDIERWLAKFNTICELNKWVDDETKGKILAVSLQKSVFEAVSDYAAPLVLTTMKFEEICEALRTLYVKQTFVISCNYAAAIRKQAHLCEYDQIKDVLM